MTWIWSDALYALGYCGIFALILLMGEGVRRAAPGIPELARKFSHFLSGITVLSFPYVFESNWVVLLIAMIFSVVFVLARRLNLLRSVLDIERQSYGELYFLIAVCIIYILGHERSPISYFIAILVMTISDTFAALLGERYGSYKFKIEDSSKSLEGSVVFFFITFLCVHLPLLLMSSIDRANSVIIALIIALLVTGLEAISTKGSDNIFVPYGTYYLVKKMSSHTLALNVEDLLTLLVMITATIPITMKSRLFETSSLIGLVLLNYVALALGGFYWDLPGLLALLLLYLLANYFMQKVAKDVRTYQLMALLYTALVPLIILFAANTINDQDTLYLPYVASIVGQIAVSANYFVTITKDNQARILMAMRANSAIRVLICAAASTIFIAVVPVLLYWQRSELSSIGIIAVSACISLYVYERLAAKYNLPQYGVLRQKMRAVSSAIAAVVVFFAQLLLSGE